MISLGHIRNDSEGPLHVGSSGPATTDPMRMAAAATDQIEGDFHRKLAAVFAAGAYIAIGAQGVNFRSLLKRFL